MWGKALRGIPRLSTEEWQDLDIISRWLIATRAAVLVMTFISAAIAGILAFRDGAFVWWRWLLLAAGLILAHATNNLLNDLVDHKKGVDQGNYFRTQYGLQPLEMGLLSEKHLLRYAGITGGLAIAAGLPLVLTSGWIGWALLAAGAFFVLFYTWPLKYIGLGEIAVILVWGPLMVGGGYYVITGQWSWLAILASLPYALGTTMVIFGKHIDKLEADRAKGIHTLPVIIGEAAARYVTLGMIGLQYILVFYLVISREFTPALVFVVMAADALPSVWQVYKNPRPQEKPENYPADAWPLYYVALAFVHNRKFGMWYFASLILDVVFKYFHLFG
jgi:1,4-dihydroxy-2-naphthoate octaprenyltransferase